jgi:hypothetical protein
VAKKQTKNAADITLRNVRAANKRLLEVAAVVAIHGKRLHALERAMEQRFNLGRLSQALDDRLRGYGAELRALQAKRSKSPKARKAAKRP